MSICTLKVITQNNSNNKSRKKGERTCQRQWLMNQRVRNREIEERRNGLNKLELKLKITNLGSIVL